MRTITLWLGEESLVESNSVVCCVDSRAAVNGFESGNLGTLGMVRGRPSRDCSWVAVGLKIGWMMESEIPGDAQQVRSTKVVTLCSQSRVAGLVLVA